MPGQLCGSKKSYEKVNNDLVPTKSEERLSVPPNLHLDGPRLRIRRRLERLQRILEPKPMRHQPLQVHHAALDEPDRPRPRVAVAVLQLHVHLAHARAHKRNRDLVPAHADDEHLAAKLDGPDGARDGRLHARALHGHGGLDAAKGRHHLPGRLLGGLERGRERDPERLHAGADLGREGEAARVDVGDDEGARARGLAAQHGDEADGAGAAHQDRIAEADVCALEAREGDAEGFEEGAVLVG